MRKSGYRRRAEGQPDSDFVREANIPRSSKNHFHPHTNRELNHAPSDISGIRSSTFQRQHIAVQKNTVHSISSVSPPGSTRGYQQQRRVEDEIEEYEGIGTIFLTGGFQSAEMKNIIAAAKNNEGAGKRDRRWGCNRFYVHFPCSRNTIFAISLLILAFLVPVVIVNIFGRVSNPDALSITYNSTHAVATHFLHMFDYSVQHSHDQAFWFDHIVVSDGKHLLIPESFESRLNAEVAPILEAHVHRVWDESKSNKLDCARGEQLLVGFSLAKAGSLPAGISYERPCTPRPNSKRCIQKKRVTDLRDIVLTLPRASSRSTYKIQVDEDRAARRDNSDVPIPRRIKPLGAISGPFQVELSDGARLALQRYCGIDRKNFAEDLDILPVTKDNTRILTVYELKRLFDMWVEGGILGKRPEKSWDQLQFSKLSINPIEHSRHGFSLHDLKTLLIPPASQHVHPHGKPPDEQSSTVTPNAGAILPISNRAVAIARTDSNISNQSEQTDSPNGENILIAASINEGAINNPTTEQAETVSNQDAKSSPSSLQSPPALNSGSPHTDTTQSHVIHPDSSLTQEHSGRTHDEPSDMQFNDDVSDLDVVPEDADEGEESSSEIDVEDKNENENRGVTSLQQHHVIMQEQTSPPNRKLPQDHEIPQHPNIPQHHTLHTEQQQVAQEYQSTTQGQIVSKDHGIPQRQDIYQHHTLYTAHQKNLSQQQGSTTHSENTSQYQSVPQIQSIPEQKPPYPQQVSPPHPQQTINHTPPPPVVNSPDETLKAGAHFNHRIQPVSQNMHTDTSRTSSLFGHTPQTTSKPQQFVSTPLRNTLPPDPRGAQFPQSSQPTSSVILASPLTSSTTTSLITKQKYISQAQLSTSQSPQSSSFQTTPYDSLYAPPAPPTSTRAPPQLRQAPLFT